MTQKKVVDATQREAGDDKDWINEPKSERSPDLLVHTEKPFNAEPPYKALTDMITAKGSHYRRQHTPVPVVDEKAYRVQVGFEGQEPKEFSLEDLHKFSVKDIAVTFMCTGNRRSEYNTEEDGETMGLPWRIGSISTARWTGASFREVLRASGIELEAAEDAGYNWVTFRGLEDYHVSIPITKALNRHGDVILAWHMNGETLPRDHGFPLRVVVPGIVGARSVKWLKSVTLTKDQTDGMHQRGIAYKQLAPNVKALSEVSKEYIESLPPIDHVPIMSAISFPEPNQSVQRGDKLKIGGYAYAGSGFAVIRVDVSLDGGKTWRQPALTRADDTQGSRSGKAWAWVQWRIEVEVPNDAGDSLEILCKAVDDQYNQQPHDAKNIWNLRGLLNSSWGRCVVKPQTGMSISPEAMSGDNTINNVGIRMGGKFQCEECRQRFDTEAARKLHWKFIHDPNRHQED